MREYLGKWLRDRDVLLIGFLLIVRLVVFGMGPGIINGDGFLYVQAAQHIAQTGTLPPPSFQSRTYSIAMAPILALLGHDAIWVPLPNVRQYYHPTGVAVHWFQLLLDLGVVLILLHVFTAMRPRNIWAFRAGLVVIAIQPITAAWTNFIVPDTAATLAFVGGLWLVARSAREAIDWRRLAIGSLLCGISGVIRVDMAVLSVAVLAVWLLVVFLPRGIAFAARGIALSAVLFLVPAGTMAAYQWVSTRNLVYIDAKAGDNPTVRRAGYFAWTRAWVTTPGDFKTFILGAERGPDWPGYDAAAYPARAFGSAQERAALAPALAAWKNGGYSAQIDTAVSNANKGLRAARPAQLYTAGALRTAQLWVSSDGPAALTWGIGAERSVAKLGVAATLALKALLGLLALLGCWIVVGAVRRSRRKAFVDYPTAFAVLALLALLFRAIEMFVINLTVGGAGMEARYVIETWPGLIALAGLGWRAIADRFARESAVDATANGG